MEHCTSKNLPCEIRPYERCIRQGPAVLNDAELLAVILRTGSAGENSVELASRLLSLGNISELVDMTIPELTRIKGIGKIKAIQLQCIGELCRRMAQKVSDNIVFNSPDKIADYYMQRFCCEKQEYVLLLLLDNKGQLIRDVILTKGTINQSLLSPREVFVEAYRYQAVKIILLHNHPSGDPSPSHEDIAVTKRIAEIGAIASIPLLDHIIIGNHRYISLKERGYI